MPKPIFLFRFRKDATTYYQVDPSGAVVTSAVAVNIKKSVIDWKTLAIDYRRHSVYHGVFRQYSPEMIRIANDGAKILRHIFKNLGDTEALCELEVYKLNKSDQQYYPRCLCKINFGKHEDNEQFVSTSLMEGGLSARLNAYDTTDFPIEMPEPITDDDDVKWLWMSGFPPGSSPGGVMLLGSYNYKTQPDVESTIQIVPGESFEDVTPGMFFVNEEGAYAVVATNSTLPNLPIPGSPLDNVYQFKAIQDFTGTLHGTFNFQRILNEVTSSHDARLMIIAKVWNPDYSHLVTTSVLYSDVLLTPGSFSPTTSMPFSWTNAFNKNDVITISLRASTPAPLVGGELITFNVKTDATATDVILDFQYRQPDTPCRALSHWQMFRKLFQAVAGVSYDPISDLLTTDVYPGPDVFNLNPKNTFFTCGDALRQLYHNADGTIVNPIIRTNFQDFTKDAEATLCAGIGIELDSAGREVLRFEKLEHFYQKDVLITDLGGKIKNWRMYPYADYKANNIKAGYNSQTYDETNGRFEFNAATQYQTSVTSLQKDIDNKSPYRHDCYGEDYVRANLANKQTTDSTSDNDTFKVQSNGNRMLIPGMAINPYQVDKAQTITAGIDPVVAPTLFNVMFSPARNMARCMKYLKSIYYKIVDPVLKFTVGADSKNTDMVSSMYTGPMVTENADIDLTPDGTNDDILFKPWVFEFEAQVPIDLPDLMATNPYGVFGHRPLLRGKKYYLEGFVLEAGIMDGVNDVYTFKLLCSPNSELPD